MCILAPTAQMQLVQGLWKIVIVCAVVIAGLVLVALERDGTLAPNVSSWLLWLPLEAVALLALGVSLVDTIAVCVRRNAAPRAALCSRALLLGCSMCLVALVVLIVLGSQTAVGQGVLPFSIQLTPVYPLLVCIALWFSVKCSSAQRAEGFAERFCLGGCFACFLIACGFPAVVLIGLKLDRLLDFVPWAVAMAPLFVLDAAGLVANCGCCALWCIREREARLQRAEGMPAGFAVLTVLTSALLLPCAVAQTVLCVKGDSLDPKSRELDPIYAVIPLLLGWGVPFLVIVGDVTTRGVRWCDRRRIESYERMRTVLSARDEQSKRNLLLPSSSQPGRGEGGEGSDEEDGHIALMNAGGHLGVEEQQRRSDAALTLGDGRSVSAASSVSAARIGDAAELAAGLVRQRARSSDDPAASRRGLRCALLSARKSQSNPSLHSLAASTEAEEARVQLEAHLAVLVTTRDPAEAGAQLGEAQELVRAHATLRSPEIKQAVLRASSEARGNLGEQWSTALAAQCGRALREFSYSKTALRRMKSARSRSATEEENLVQT